jgi:UMF1 family MFS transporter
VFFLLALPMMIFFKDKKTETTTAIKKVERNHFYKKLIPFFSVSVAAPLLVAFFFYNDALVTVTNNLSIYLENVFEISNTKKSIILMVIVVMNAIGALLSGWIGDKIGIRKTLTGVLIAWIVALPIVAITANITIFMVLTALVGILIGAMWAVSRAYMSLLLTKEDL